MGRVSARECSGRVLAEEGDRWSRSHRIGHPSMTMRSFILRRHYGSDRLRGRGPARRVARRGLPALARLLGRSGRHEILVPRPDSPRQRLRPRDGLDLPYRRHAEGAGFHDPVHPDRDRRPDVPHDPGAQGGGPRRGLWAEALAVRSLRRASVPAGPTGASPTGSTAGRNASSLPRGATSTPSTRARGRRSRASVTRVGSTCGRGSIATSFRSP